jgi:tRNA U34 5-methylaminomethyl-2-thiouridine-forming methyltransferase MnmC
MHPFKVITADNSPTLFVPGLNEHYGSVNGALNESLHVFIEAGLHSINEDSISILEIGFGTGLNTLLTLIDPASSHKTIRYETIEKFPLSSEIIDDLAKETIFNNDSFRMIHNAPWNKEVNLSDTFTLKKKQIDLEHYLPIQKFSLIYFDAFSPDKQPELWTKEIFRRLYDAGLPGCNLVTYSSKGSVKQALRDAGFTVTRLKGPQGKHHMVRAIK